MTPRIETLSEKKLVGKSVRMSIVQNRTFEVWQGFMQQRDSIINTVSPDKYSMQVYEKSFDFVNFDPTKEFTKWAAIEVSDFDNVPQGFESYTIQGGLYAVFIHKGFEFEKTMQMIFGQWLPNSQYQLDHREHFELLGEKYNRDDPASEEEVWVPIAPR